ncbi:MAG: peptidoglycan DD-metalloendopeptidase family protein [Bacteroidales bacterium]|nr:peptidoglycan DD-metalloendopeptidase family protein [Bacteroidales bacterium]
MWKKIVIYVVFACGCASGTAGVLPVKSPCERLVRHNARKLAKVASALPQPEERCDSLLTLCVYAYPELSAAHRQSLSEIQSALRGIQTEEAEETLDASACAARACLLLAESFFYQRDYDSVRTYLERASRQASGTPLALSVKLWMLRTDIAERDWEAAAYRTEQQHGLWEAADTLTGETLAYALLETDYRLQTNPSASDGLRLLRELEDHASLETPIRERLWFIRGQLCLRTGQYREALRCFSGIVEASRRPTPLYAYAYVYRDACLHQIAVDTEDSLHAAALLRANSSPFEPTMVESRHDSDFIYAIYPYYFQDMASRYFLDERLADEEDTLEFDHDLSWYDDNDTTSVSMEMLSMVFENWDSVSIHIPKADFSHLQDTICLPLVGEGYCMPPFTQVTSEFGWRRYRYHYGVDTKNKTGDTIRCLFDGYVRIAKRSRTYGNVVVVRHLNGLETFYAHCSRLLVAQNQEVKAGNVLALVGSTGRSTGPHLHFETRYKGVPFNPRYMIDFDSNCLHSDTLKITRETFNYLKPYGGSGAGSSSNAMYYKVRPGDTLSQIARKHHTTVAALKRLNGLRSDFIRDGQRLRIR